MNLNIELVLSIIAIIISLVAIAFDDYDALIKHGEEIIEVERTFEGIKKYLSEHEIEGLVFWKDGIPQCKIKRSDFGFEWPVKSK